MSPVRLFPHLFCVASLGLACTPDSDGKASHDRTADETGEPSDSGAVDTGSRDCAPPDGAPAPTVHGHPTDGWRWTKQGALFEDTEVLEYTEGDLSPTLVDTGAGLHLLFSRQRGTEQSMWASTSSDGAHWSTPVAVTGLDPSAIEYPSLQFKDGGFHLWYGSGSVDYATSSDGFDYTPVDTVLRTPDAGELASVSLLYPHVVWTETGIDLWYTGFDGARFAIGRASNTSPGETFTDGERVLSHDPDGWDNTSVAMPMVVDRDGTQHVWYGGYDTVIANPGPWRVGRYDAETGQRAVSVPLAESGLDAWSTRDPAVVPWGDGWRMVYVGMGDDGVYRLMSATSDVCN